MTPEALAALQGRAAEAAPQVHKNVPMVPGLVMHLDGDMVCYSCAGNDDTTPGEARMNALALIEKLRARSGAESTVVHMTAPGSHKGERYLVATVKPYQGQRTNSRRPKNHSYLQDWLMQYTGDAFRVKTWKTREADDGIAVCAYHATTTPLGYIVIATADKDMRMLPGLHIDWKTHKLVRVMPGDFEVYGEAEGDKPAKLYGSKWFWMQMLMGDAADNTPGLPKYCTTDSKGRACEKPMGPATAEKFLARCKNNAAAFAEVYGLYCEYYGLSRENDAEIDETDYCLADAMFCEQAALLWMRTDNTATINNFCTHKGPGCISEAFPDELRVAAAMLVKRVEKLRNEANALSD